MPVEASRTDQAMPHRVVTSWLGEERAARLLSYAVSEESRFTPTKVLHDKDSGTLVDESFRRSLVLRDLGPFDRLLHDMALALQPELETAFGMGHMRPQEAEIELVAHGDGAFYRPHIDTFTRDSDMPDANRRLSLVYYFHQRPPRFTGGRLRLLGLGSGQAVAVEPTHDSLLAFPSFLPHEVEQVSCPRGSFADSRFAVNIWLCSRS